MKFARGLLIFAYGLFTIAVQTLLFREFVTAFEGNDISVGVFFGSWFLWIGLGALLVRRWHALADALLEYVELLFLIYVPAFVGQLLLIVHVRELAGVASYDLMGVETVIFWALLVNVPVSLLTGMLFPLACRWIESGEDFAVSRVYVLEAMGSLAGGLGVTAFLAFHVDSLRIALGVMLALCVSVAVAGIAASPMSRVTKVGRRFPLRLARTGIPLLLVILLGLCLTDPAQERLSQQMRLAKWAKLLPTDSYQGAFHTPQAEYLYGQYRGQWVAVREGAVCEALPNEAAAGQTAAVSLCQVPRARRILVIGSGLALCRQLLSLPQIEEVAWAHADVEYVEQVHEYVPQEYRIDDPRFKPIAEELRRYLVQRHDRFDLILLNLPDVTGSVFNRYFTVEFYEQVKMSLAPHGVVSASVPGGETVMGSELTGLGASVKQTLQRVFSRLVLVPGDETWLIASDSESLTGDPARVRDQFAAIQGAETIFPPAGLLSLYLPDRAARAREGYEKVDLPPGLLINRDARPLTHLYSLLLAARQSGASVTRFIKLLLLGGWMPFAIPIVVFAVLRLWSLTRVRRGPGSSGFDSSFLVFSTGWVSIAVVVVLMYLYQTRFGSLYLYVGVISSLFMAGLTMGALLARRILSCAWGVERGRRAAVARFLLIEILAHSLLLGGLALWFVDRASSATTGPQAFSLVEHGLFAVILALSGLCCGGYWPLAAAGLEVAGFDSVQTASRLETADHLGACLGGLVTSLLMMPLLGAVPTLLILGALALANVPAAVATLWRREPPSTIAHEGFQLTKVGYVLFGIGVCVVLCSNVLSAAGRRLQPTLPDYAVHALLGERDVQEASVVLERTGRRIRYFSVPESEGQSAGYVFSSADLAPDVHGFGGKINLAISVDDTGSLRDFLIVRSDETPSYLELLREWLETLKGQTLFTRRPFAGVNTVTGATVSSEAVLDALSQAAQRFAVQVLDRDIAAPDGHSFTRHGSGWKRFVPEAEAMYVVGAFAAAALGTLWGRFRVRFVILAFTFLVGGVVLNAQYSTEQIVALLSFHIPRLDLSSRLLLTIGVPLLIVLFGNVYCGYLCPFGAAQELLGYVLPQRFKPRISRTEMRIARSVKYVVLLVVVVTFFVSRNRTTLSGDPLIFVFSIPLSAERLRAVATTWPAWTFLILGVALAGSLLVVRFWCRYLCPAGAFLSLLNRFALLGRWLPSKRFGRCEFGLTPTDRLDCIHCDRCRYVAKWGRQPQQAGGPGSAKATIFARPFVIAVLTVGILVVGVTLSRFTRVMPTMADSPTGSVATGGQPRDVDAQRIRALITQGRLSDKEAEFYTVLQGDRNDAKAP